MAMITPTASVVTFDAAGLFRALDLVRTERGLSWSALAVSIWDLSAELNQQRGDHPISPSTITGMPKRNATSCQHALFMLRWLGRSPEEFLMGPVVDVGDITLPSANAAQRPRWRLKKLYAAVDGRRRDQALTWQQLAARLECTPNQLTGLRTARFATGMTLAMRMTQWLERPAADFVYAASW